MKPALKVVAVVSALLVLVGMSLGLTRDWKLTPAQGRATNGFVHGPPGSNPTVSSGAPVIQGSNPMWATMAPSSPAPSASNDVLKLLDEVVANPWRRVKMSEVPPSSPAQEAELIRRFEETSSITNRHAIARILLFGGSARVTGLMTNMLVRDYAGQMITDGDGHRLFSLFTLLGVTARRDDSALDFLLKGVEPGNWERIPLWNTPIGQSERISAFREICLVGLAISGRSEAMALMQELRDDPERAAELDVPGGMLDAAFAMDRIKEAGLAGYMDLSAYDRISAYANWRMHTTNGIAWGQWRARVDKLIYEKRH